jgi:hypothetical protein
MRRSIAGWLRFLTLIQNFCRPPRYWSIAVLRSYESKKTGRSRSAAKKAVKKSRRERKKVERRLGR